jgi:hypothetical protein
VNGLQGVPVAAGAFDAHMGAVEIPLGGAADEARAQKLWTRLYEAHRIQMPVIAFAGVAELATPVSFPVLGPVPLWVSLAICDFGVKLLIAILALAPYGALLAAVRPVEAATRAPGWAER